MMSKESRELRAFVNGIRDVLGLDPLYGSNPRGQRYRVWPIYKEHQDQNYMTIRSFHGTK